MVASVTNLDSDLVEMPGEEKPPSLLKTALVGESLLMLFSCIALGACASIYFSTTPLSLFLGGLLLPIAACFAIIFNDPYYEDPVKREKYRAEISTLGLEAFIEKHGWERLERYGFCFSGSSPLITKETYTEAFFEAPRVIDSPLIWRGLEHDLFLDKSFDDLADLLLGHVSQLINDGRFWIAYKRGLFKMRKNELLARLSKHLRTAEGYDILAIWTRLDREGLVPAAFPLKLWAQQNCAAVETFELSAKRQKDELRLTYLESRAALKEEAERVRQELLREKEPDMHQLREIAKNLDQDLTQLDENYTQNLEKIKAQEQQLRAAVCTEFETKKEPFGLYFTFDTCSLGELIQRFGFAAIKQSRLEFNFPTETEWSDKFISEPNPPLWISLEKKMLDARGRLKAENMLLEAIGDPWDIVDKPAVLRAVDLGLFKDKSQLKNILSAIDPLRDPLRILRCYGALHQRALVPSQWEKYPWLSQLGPQFEARRKYFEASDEDSFLKMQQERWQREVLEMIYDVEDQTKFQSDLEQMPLREFVLCYGWDCILQLCLEDFSRRFLAECPSVKKQLASGLLWPLVERGLLDDSQKKELELALTEEVAKGLKTGDVQQAFRIGLFADPRRLRGAIDHLDPKQERTLLVRVWPWLRGNGLVGENLREISNWFDQAAEGVADEKGFAQAYQDYLSEREWREESLAQWAKRHGGKLFLKRMMQDHSLVDRWEREDPLWSSDRWNWIFLERGLLSDEHVRRWMRAWIHRHPTFREKVLSQDFARALSMALFSDEDLKLIAASFHHPSTFAFARDLIRGLDAIADLQIAFSPEEKLLYNWAKDHRSWRDEEALEREFTAYKKQIGWRGNCGFGFESETKCIETQQGKGLFQKVFDINRRLNS